LAIDAENAEGGGNPEVSEIVGHDGVDEWIISAEVDLRDLVVFDARKASDLANPDRPVRIFREALDIGVTQTFSYGPVIEFIVLEAEDAIDARNEEGTVMRGLKIANPIKLRLFIFENVGS